MLASPEVGLAMGLHGALQAGRWVAFFRTLGAAPYLAACAGNMYSQALRADALHALVKSLGAPAWTLSYIERSHTWLPALASRI